MNKPHFLHHFLHKLVTAVLLYIKKNNVTVDNMSKEHCHSTMYNRLKHQEGNYRISRPIRRTVIFSLEILEKNDECILILAASVV
jgi:hypothetical protein